MKVVIQRVTQAAVVINEKEVASIKNGLLILVGIAPNDTTEDSAWLCRKIANLRIFADEKGVMNKSIVATDGAIIVVSQFTLHASTIKGNRPSYMNAAKPAIAISKYHEFVATLEKEVGKEVQTGEFGADMSVSLVNDGPVTLIVDSKNKL